MSQWFRVFGTNETEPAPPALLGHLEQMGVGVQGHFHGDDQGWFRAELIYAEEEEPLTLERFLASEEGIRGELNTWAAWLETVGANPNHQRLMRHMIGTAQLFTLSRPVDPEDDLLVDELCICISRFLAQETDGVYQVDNQGFFAADGTLLLQE